MKIRARENRIGEISVSQVREGEIREREVLFRQIGRLQVRPEKDGVSGDAATEADACEIQARQIGPIEIPPRHTCVDLRAS